MRSTTLIARRREVFAKACGARVERVPCAAHAPKAGGAEAGRRRGRALGARAGTRATASG
jgi:hypothetical protein